MKEIKIAGQCTRCSTHLAFSTNIPDNPLEMAPEVRGKIKPSSFEWKYFITSEEIKVFIANKAKKLVSDVKVELVPRYCEKKRRRENEPHHSYASLRIAFSDEARDSKGDYGYYSKIGESSGNVHVVQSLFKEIISRYQYDRKQINEWMNSYRTLEELEDGLGMTEAYLSDLRAFSTPRRVKESDDRYWIIFAAAAEKVIIDMLTDAGTNKLIGKMKIHDVYPISKDVVQFEIHLDPNEIVARENPVVRQIMLGEAKPKKD